VTAPDRNAVPRWEHFPHEADIGLRGTGRTLGEAFEQTALALTAVIVDPRSVACTQCIEIDCGAPDDELLLVEWLNTLIYEMATRRMLFGRYEVALDAHHLRARAWGEPVDVVRHQPTVEVKGATYTALRVAADAEGVWQAQCVVDV
jgi:tRNA nucleotidyltransferase (CCA-adding enzyme)